MRFGSSKILTLLTLVCVVSTAFPQSYVQRIDKYSFVDWQRLIVRTTGNSALLKNDDRFEKMAAVEKARLAAENNLFNAVKALSFDSEIRISDLLLRKKIDPGVLFKVVKRFTIVDTRSMSDMSVELDIELPLTGPLSAVLFPTDMEKGKWFLSQQPLCPTCWQPWPEGKPVPDGVKLIVPSEGFVTDSGQPFTGLILDCRGLNLAPTLLPKILNENNEEIYGLKFTNRSLAVKSGVVVYVSEMSKALKNKRSGVRPLIIRGLKSAGISNADVVVSNSDALIIHAVSQLQDFLKSCKVVIVWNR
ncbi:MAG: hypothetical protein ACE5HS_01840 [bacterium]